MKSNGLPEKQGLYDPQFEHDACGVGFVAHIKGEKSNSIISRGIEILENMSHRGAAGADPDTGDGAGITIQMPQAFLETVCPGLPELGQYGTGLVFLPQDPREAAFCKAELEKVILEEGQSLLYWRDVPVASSEIGKGAREVEPRIAQVFIRRSGEASRSHFERKLYVIRRVIENRVRESKLRQASYFYIPSLSSNTFVYKGLLLPEQLKSYFLDLQAPEMASGIALVHSRFSTNTFPTWNLAHPFRFLAHNGEINTIKGNIFKMNARESSLASELFGDDIKKLLPIVQEGGSDSASIDNALELLVAGGRWLPHALMMLIPEAWNDLNPIPDNRRAFYEYHSTFMEPWDGPATIAATDGRIIAATVDRNGLRPARYVVTKDDLVVLASEMGVQTFAPENIQYKGRLYPGKMLVVNTEEGRVMPDDEVKDVVSKRRPYREWLDQNRINLADVPWDKKVSPALDEKKLYETQRVFGYNSEDVNSIILPMARDGAEPTGSMGTDTPLAVLSEKPQRLFSYFKQLFAQVTNPPIDSIREELVMSLVSYIGCQKNLLEETAEHCRMIRYTSPIFSNTLIEKLTKSEVLKLETVTIPILFKKADGVKGLEAAVTALCEAASDYIRKGCHYILLSDRGMDEANVPIPSLLAVSALNHHLVREKTRSQVGLILETGEAREVMHFALLYGYGVDVINPYAVFATIADLVDRKSIEIDYETAEKNYIKAVGKGLLKIMSKMGISTLRSYKGAQLFEAIGISKECTDRYFTGTSSRVNGIGLKDIAREAIAAHDAAYEALKGDGPKLLPSDGVYHYRREGERHAWNPETIKLLQKAVREDELTAYRAFSAAVDRFNRDNGTLRGFFEFRESRPIPLEEVEPAENLAKRFCTGAMSYGSISKEAHETLAMAMNQLGGKSNTGEGGEESARFLPRPDGLSARSAIKQIASARFGVTNHYLRNADEIQIKIAQGAKPGEGGQLPGHKVNEIIAKVRHSTPGVTLISPPPHHDIYSIEDLAQLIYDLKHVNPKARVSVKLVAEVGVGTVAAGVAKAHADTVTVSGYEGGTGASPISSIKHAGVPWEFGVAETQQTLVLNNLRGRVRLHTDGQLKNGRDVLMAALLGADEFGFSTAPLISMGCVMMRKCHLNTCPVGVATQDPELRKRFRGTVENVVRYFRFVANEVRELMASLGIRTFDELIGRSDLLRVREIPRDESLISHKTRHLDLSAILYRPKVDAGVPIRYTATEIHKVSAGLDEVLLEKVKPFFDLAQNERPVPFKLDLPIRNTDRTVGALLSGEISERFGEAGLPEGSIFCRLRGTAGQSFGAFLARGVHFRLKGDANDYLGKSLSGGHITVIPPKGSTFASDKNIIVGNTVLYGAIAGRAFIRGVAGERFAVRNSGAVAVVEGVGDHGCEYMTGGCVVVLGRTGRNFAAGMSGGVAYVFDSEGSFPYFCNPGLVELSPILDAEEKSFLKALLEDYVKETGSEVAQTILQDWKILLPKFVKLTPIEYKEALAKRGLKARYYPPEAIRGGAGEVGHGGS